MIPVVLVTHLLLLFSLFGECTVNSISFNGIPAAFGDLDSNQRTDIVVIGDDGTRLDIYYQHQRQLQLPFSCKSDEPVIQVYLADMDGDGNPDILPLTLGPTSRGINKLYSLKRLKVNFLKESPTCEFTDLGVEMTAQPLLFDHDGDLRTDLMSLDKDGIVSVWKAKDNKFDKMPTDKWSWISREYFNEPHSNSFIDMNHDGAADIVLSAGSKIAYLYADPDHGVSFSKYSKEFTDLDKSYEYGQSTMVDINADGKIDHIIPRCKRHTKQCDVIVLYDNLRKEVIFNFHDDYLLQSERYSDNYLFPITLRASDLDGDGYTDFVTVANRKNDSKSVIVFMHNILDQDHVKSDQNAGGSKLMSRTFEIQEIVQNTSQKLHLVTLFDINEDGKVDMLIGASEHSKRPQDLNITARMNTQMVDACFMKVLVTNGYCSSEAGSNGQSARGPFICFELSQNDGKKMQGCAGQLAQSSHFALQQPYVIFGLGQTPHFVETLNVSIPGFGTDGRVRTRLLEQIVPDAQVIIIPRQKEYPNSWDYKMFLSPMSDLVFSTLIALAVLCLLILFIIFILHRQETLEDAAEHEEYKRHWPESR